jgi:hypothetical protein
MLPPIGDQTQTEDPLVRVAFFLPLPSIRKWYAIEGETCGSDFQFRGLITAADSGFGGFYLSDMECTVSPAGDHVQCLIFDPAIPLSRAKNLLGNISLCSRKKYVHKASR